MSKALPDTLLGRPPLLRSARGPATGAAAPGGAARDRPPRPLLAGGAAGLLVLAVVLRISLWGYKSADVTVFFEPWRAFLLEQGGFAGLGQEFADYTPPYLMLLAASTALDVDTLLAVKLISSLCDIALVIGAFLVLRRVVVASARRTVVGLGLILFSPTVVLNGSAWGQVDAGFTAVLLAALTMACTRRPAWAMALFGLALGIKLQAVFLGPLFLVLFLRGALPLRSLLAAPLGYLLAFLPALVAGRPPSILYSIYVGQAGTYQDMTLFAPSVWQFFPDRPELLATPGTILALALVLLVLLMVLQRPEPLTRAHVLRLALMFALLCPYVLPHMHDRYFFLADVLAILYAVARPGRWWIAVAVNLASLLSYLPFLFGSPPPVPFPVLSLVMGAALVGVVADVVARPRAGSRSAGGDLRLMPLRRSSAPAASRAPLPPSECVGSGRLPARDG